MSTDLEALACRPRPVDMSDFNPSAQLPYGCTSQHVYSAMRDFLDFLGFVDSQLHGRGIQRLETMLMPANFSSLVGEFMVSSIPRYCRTIVKNLYHNGHPDLIPSGRFPDDAVQYADEGIEIKGSRYRQGWQGHNPEDTWLMVFVFDSNRPIDAHRGIEVKPFHFVMVVGARLMKEDWSFAGRSETSRRTITASVTRSGYEKMVANWIYRAPELQQSPLFAPRLPL